MEINVLIQTTVVNPQWQAAVDEATEFYRENETKHKLYTSPKTLEDHEVHLEYKKLMARIEELPKGEEIDWEPAVLLAIESIEGILSGVCVFRDEFHILEMTRIKYRPLETLVPLGMPFLREAEDLAVTEFPENLVHEEAADEVDLEKEAETAAEQPHLSDIEHPEIHAHPDARSGTGKVLDAITSRVVDLGDEAFEDLSDDMPVEQDIEEDEDGLEVEVEEDPDDIPDTGEEAPSEPAAKDPAAMSGVEYLEAMKKGEL